MARPRKIPDERRNQTLAARLTAAERVQIEQAAADAGMTASDYMRMQALRGRISVPARRSLDHAAFEQLRRLGVNLNQLTRIANQTQELPAGLSRCCAALEELLLRELQGQDADAPGGAGDTGDGEPDAGNDP